METFTPIRLLLLLISYYLYGYLVDQPQLRSSDLGDWVKNTLETVRDESFECGTGKLKIQIP